MTAEASEWNAERAAIALLREAAADGLIQATEPRHQPEMVNRLVTALGRAFYDGKDVGRTEAIDDLIDYLTEIR